MFMNVATIDVSHSEDMDKRPPNYSASYTNPVFTEDPKPCFISNVMSRVNFESERDKSSQQIKNDSRVSIADFSIADTKDYDPHDFCNSKKPTTYCDTLVHLLKAAIGTGILAIPSAFKDAGYAVGVVGLIIMGAFYTYCIHMLLSSEYELCKRRRQVNMSYAATVQAAFEEGPKRLRWLAGVGQFAANFFFMLYESGGCAVYIIFISSNLKQLLDYYFEADFNLRLIMAYVTIPLILCCWIRNLKLLAPLSAIANVLMVISFCLVFWYVFQQAPSFEGRRARGEPSKLPMYLTTVLFSVASTGLILPLKNEMKSPKSFSTPLGVMNVSMIPISFLYVIFGFFGYLKYGDDIKGSITLNLPQAEGLAQLIKGLYSLTIFISYHLCYYVVYDIVWKNFLQGKIQTKKLFWEYVMRTLIPVVTFLMACAIPNLDLFISLVGAVGISTTSLVIPIITHWLVFWDHYTSITKRSIYFIKNLLLLCISLMIFFTGVTESVSDIIKTYYK
ncbi:proton-coupled amino acid transporter-like protein CG1139 [Planococcus citri]|uniref:proton-coupled amino acid transporter-like protein CG1139 n=1 Tax=Planococcus citri TaxID=170843 RepID=UPI0031F8F43B